MLIFETPRLIIKTLEAKDKNYFIELLSDSKIIDPIPQEKISKKEILEKFSENLNIKKIDLENKKCVCGIFEKDNSEMIGLCLFLINEDKERELGYRFRANYWGNGYGKEIAKGMINYYFNELIVDMVTADVNIENMASIKILERFMKPESEFYNEKGNYINRRYKVYKNNWIQK